MLIPPDAHMFMSMTKATLALPIPVFAVGLFFQVESYQ